MAARRAARVADSVSLSGSRKRLPEACDGGEGVFLAAEATDVGVGESLLRGRPISCDCGADEGVGEGGWEGTGARPWRA